MVVERRLGFGVLATRHIRSARHAVGTNSRRGRGSIARALLRRPGGRLQHALVVVFDNGATIPVTQDSLLGMYVTAPDGSSAFRSYGFFNAVANTYGLAGSYYLVDLTTHEQAPANSAELAFTAWAPLTLSTPPMSPFVLVSASDGSGSYTFHTSSGSLQSVTPYWSSGTDPATNASWAGYVVSGSAGLGETFWVTRDADNASSPQALMVLNSQFQDWSGSFPPLPTRNIQSISFQIGQSRDGHTLGASAGWLRRLPLRRAVELVSQQLDDLL